MEAHGFDRYRFERVKSDKGVRVTAKISDLLEVRPTIL